MLYPHSDQRPAIRRPALIVQRDQLDAGIPQIIVAMITSNLQGTPHLSRVLLKASSTEGSACGLMTDSVIRTDNLAIIREEEFDKKLGAYPDMNVIDSALRHTLGL